MRRVASAVPSVDVDIGDKDFFAAAVSALAFARRAAAELEEGSFVTALAVRRILVAGLALKEFWE